MRIFFNEKVSFHMITKLLGGLAVAAGLISAGIYGTSDSASEPTCCTKANACCSKDCCKDCPDCSCECDCCKDCENGCECPNMK